MIVKNNYNECITNFACSIRKYFGLDCKHNTLSYVDELLLKYKPKNVVTILCDGMGSKVLSRALDRDSFLMRNKIKDITTVFPATTVAATTSITTGLNPVETGMLGWTTYYKELDKIVTTFLNYEKGDDSCLILDDALNYKNKHMKTRCIHDEINDNGMYKGYGLFPFGKNLYKNVDEMFLRIRDICMLDDKKYIYAYTDEPDHSMHEIGSNNIDAYTLIENLNNKIESLCNDLEDTIIFVIADHGHINIENIDLRDYKDLFDCLKRDVSMEPRAVNFFVKEDKKDLFVKFFNKYFSSYFDLFSMDDVIKSKLFGDGDENEIFRDELGDFLAIAKSDKALISNGDEPLVSHHAGYTEDEILIPLIVINKCKNECN